MVISLHLSQYCVRTFLSQLMFSAPKWASSSSLVMVAGSAVAAAITRDRRKTFILPNLLAR